MKEEKSELIPIKKKGSSRNRVAGHSLEREVAKILRDCGFPHAVTSRSESKKRDDEKVDIMNKDEQVNGRLPYNIQAKNCTTTIAYMKLLSELPKGSEYNVIIHNQTVKSSGGRFITKGNYAILDSVNFFKMVKELEQLKAGFALLNDYFEYIPKEEQEYVNSQLNLLGL